MSTARPPKPDFHLPTLTPQQVEVKSRVIAIDGEIAALADQRDTLTESCQHIWVPRTDKKGDPYTWCTWLKDWEIISHAFCLVCGEHSSRWYCTVSPTHVCDYDSQQDPAWDDCIHCHQPDERK
jgi:hypothetical protein